MGGPMGVVHVAFAVIAMAAGGVVFLIPKGTQLHRALGYAYVVSMLGLNVTALMIYRLFGSFGVFHYLALFSLLTVAAGFVRPTPNTRAICGSCGTTGRLAGRTSDCLPRRWPRPPCGCRSYEGPGGTSG